MLGFAIIASTKIGLSGIISCTLNNDRASHESRSRDGVGGRVVHTPRKLVQDGTRCNSQ
jgi:hypothetical protein